MDNQQRYHVVIPCSKGDVSFLPKVIRFVRMNLRGAGQVFVIARADLHRKLQTKLQKGGFEDVVLLDEDALVKGLTFARVKELLARKGWHVRQGWYFQQFLKMGFAQTVYAADYYLSWDADTLPLSELEFFDDGHPLLTIKKEYHPAYFETMERLIGMGKTFDHSFIAEHMMFKTSVMRELIACIEDGKVEGADWIEKCVNACEFSQTDIYKEPYFSEFETYGTFACTRYPDLYRTRRLNTFRGAGYVRGRHISDFVLREISIDLDIASFEAKASPPFPYNIGSWWRFRVMPKFTKLWNMPWRDIPQLLCRVVRRRVVR